jgi:dTMP kinase
VQQEFELFLRDRHDNQCRTVLPALRRGEVVILDRYYISSMAYQGARGLDPAMIRRENEKIAMRPDVVVIFELSPDAGRERRAGRAVSNNDFEHPEEQQRVAEILGELTEKDFPGLVRISADGTPEAVADRLWSAVEQAVRRVAGDSQGLDRRFWGADPVLEGAGDE